MLPRIVLMHIGKTGGTAVKYALRSQINSIKKVRLKLLAHRWTLKKITQQNPTTKVIFFVREPCDRYVSAFNSRLRQGLPRHDSPWSQRERKAFARFKTPNSLAEGLSSWNPLRRHAARKAMKAIRHCRQAYQFYLGSVSLLKKQQDRIAFIGEQEQLESDFEILKKMFGADESLVLPVDEFRSHRSPVVLDTFLSKRARRNLRKYYRRDYKIYAWCKAHREKILLSLDAAGRKAKTIEAPAEPAPRS